MQLVLVRHGAAVSGNEDPARPLSEAGRKEAEGTAGFLGPLGLPIREVWHSGKARAEETAKILAGALGEGAKLVKRNGLNPMSEPESVAEEVRTRTDDLMIVTHLPFVSRLASLLLAGSDSPEVLLFGTASAACLVHLAPDDWRVAWML